MSARKIKSYLTGGQLVLVDPDWEHIPLIRKFIPGFQVQSVRHPSDFVPNLAKTRAIRTGIQREALAEMDEAELWRIHSAALIGELEAQPEESADLLELKVELAARAIKKCELCGFLCGVNRFLKPGKCGLTHRAYAAETFVHIGEEAIINPAATIKLYNCALCCAGCQSHEIIHCKEEEMARNGKILDQGIWNFCEGFEDANTLEFVGGNPSESIFAILLALMGMPETLKKKPIGWNCHGYETNRAWDLLNGIVDVYLPDFKGCDECVARISKVPNYWRYATSGIEEMLRQNARIIVRILLLPGHFECCHKPAIEWLSQYRERLWVSLLEFIPDYRALKDPELNRCTPKEEMEKAKRLLKHLGLRDIDEDAKDFWAL